VVSLAPFEPCNPPIIGCNVAFKREVFEQVGYFDNNLGPGSTGNLVAEDVDFLYRICRKGFKIVYSPDIVVYHNHRRKPGADSKSVRRNYVRGRGAFYCKHVLGRDDAVIKIGYWETLGVAKNLVRKLLAGNTAGSEIVLLWNLVVGAMYGFKAYAPRILHSIIPRIGQDGP
jgi:GT2 family glycosyltransferase